MGEDVVRELGLLALGTRLRRAGSRLQEQCQSMLAEAELELPATHLPLLECLERNGPMAVGALAVALGLSQPAVSRQLGVLEAGAWVRSAPSREDARVRVAALAPAGRRLLQSARRVLWPVIEAAVADALGARGADLLELLDVLEGALDQASLAQRAALRGRHASA